MFRRKNHPNFEYLVLKPGNSCKKNSIQLWKTIVELDKIKIIKSKYEKFFNENKLKKI